MSKNPLIHFPGALFHITARGNNKQKIFLGNHKDFLRYLKSIKHCKNKYPFVLHGFMLMPNHIHFLIEVKDYTIAKIMQVIQTSYTMYFNIKYQRTGHLFQGRYNSFIVQKENYLLELIRYIHLNPVRAGIVKKPQDYPWSSHNVFRNKESLKEILDIIDKDFVLAQFSKYPEKQSKLYENFVLSGMKVDMNEILPKPAWNMVIGSDKFIHQIERKFKKILSRPS